MSCHNHPSGDLTPNKEDLRLTETLQAAAQLLGIKFLDQLVFESLECERGRVFVPVTETSR